jgi:hypothetical protein
MTCLKWVLTCALCVTLAPAAFAANQNDDANLTPKQKERLKELQKSLVALANNGDPDQADAKRAAVGDELKKTLTLTNQPSERSMDALAGGLTGGLGSGKVSVGQTMQLSKELSKLLSVQNISDNDVKGFVKNIEPVVNGTDLSLADRNKLYNQMLSVVNTAQKNAKNR